MPCYHIQRRAGSVSARSPHHKSSFYACYQRAATRPLQTRRRRLGLHINAKSPSRLAGALDSRKLPRNERKRLTSARPEPRYRLDLHRG